MTQIYRVSENNEEILVQCQSQECFAETSAIKQVMERYGISLFGAQGYTHDSEGKLLKGRKHVTVSKAQATKAQLEEIRALHWLNVQDAGPFAVRKEAKAKALLADRGYSI